jgi:hypothetical protein
LTLAGTIFGLAVGDVFHLLVVILHVNDCPLTLFYLDKVFLNKFSIVVDILLVSDQRLLHINPLTLG